jgi:hypothetical protein
MNTEFQNQDRSAEREAHLQRIREEAEASGETLEKIFRDNEETEEEISVFELLEDGESQSLYYSLIKDWRFTGMRASVLRDILADESAHEFYTDAANLERFHEIQGVFDDYMSRHDDNSVIGRQIDDLRDPIKIREVIETGLIPRIVTFDTSGYYSPLPPYSEEFPEGQKAYGLTSKDKKTKKTMYDEKGNKIYRPIEHGEAIRLNGKGEVVRSGLDVAEGMIAAPENYPYGTKIYLPEIGMCDVQDRGEAIVKAGERDNKYDRLDIWMGHGDLARENARDLGHRDIEAIVFGPREDIKAEMEEGTWLDRDPRRPEQIAEAGE